MPHQLFPNFTAESNILTDANITSDKINQIKAPIESALEDLADLSSASWDNDNSGETIGIDNIINFVDASAGNIDLYLPLISNLPTKKHGFFFKKQDVTTNVFSLKTNGSNKIENYTSTNLNVTETEIKLVIPKSGLSVYPASDSAYIITENYLGNTSLLSARASKNVDQTFTGESYIIFETTSTGINYDPLNLFTYTAGTPGDTYYTCPVSGLYAIRSFLVLDALSGGYQTAIELNVNGSFVDIGQNIYSDQSGSRVSISTLYRATAGDLLRIRANQVSSARKIFAGDTNAFFQVDFIAN